MSVNSETDMGLKNAQLNNKKIKPPGSKNEPKTWKFASPKYKKGAKPIWKYTQQLKSLRKAKWKPVMKYPFLPIRMVVIQEKKKKSKC